jgi:hypothetical protein
MDAQASKNPEASRAKANIETMRHLCSLSQSVRSQSASLNGFLFGEPSSAPQEKASAETAKSFFAQMEECLADLTFNLNTTFEVLAKILNEFS